MSLKRCLVASIFGLTFAPSLFGASISSFSPVAGSPGDPNFVIITGSGFFPGTLVVRFNGIQDPTAQATAADGTRIQASVPVGATTGPISVQVNGGAVASSLQDFVVIGPGPYVAGFNPTTGGDGANVTITGAHLSTVTNVSFNGKAGTLTPPTSDSSISVAAPAGVTSGLITVRNPSGQFITSSNFYVPPTIRAYSPTSGRAGTNVIITGTNFLGALSVRFGGVFSSNFLVLSNGAIQATVPTNAVTGIIRVDAPAGSALTMGSNFIVQPTIFGFSPISGLPGTNVLVMGANFTNAATPVPTVKFGGVTAGAPTGVQFGQLSVAVPSGATSGPISVITSDGTAVSPTLFYLPARITSFTPTNSPPGSIVTVTGVNFTNASAVAFNGAPATNFWVTNNTTLGVPVPANATTGPLSVTTPAGTTNSSGLFYVKPVITSFSPTNGLPGTNVLITGSNFIGATAILFNGTPATNFWVTNNNTLGAIVPASATTGPITIIAPAGTNTTAASFFVIFISDLDLTVTDNPDPVFVGSNLVYTITVVNHGPFAAQNVMLTNTLAPVTLVNVTPSQGSATNNGNSVVVSLGTLVNSASAIVTLLVRPQVTGPITNLATVSSASQDPDASNSSEATVTTVLRLPLLSIQRVPIDKVRVSWPVELTNYLLQSEVMLKATNVWSNVLTAPVIVGTEKTVTETNTGPSKFYRLIK